MTAELEVVDMQTGELVPYQPAPPPATLFRSDEPAEILLHATALADTLEPVIRQRKLFKRIGDKDHVLVEAWTLCGTMLGVFPVCVWTRPLENGWEARVEARTRDGAVIGSAEAQCTRSESTWAKRDDYALRSMAQTRATSKALRQPLGFIIHLAGFAATPAEEIPDAPSAPSPSAELLAEVDARIAVLGLTDPSWTMDATLTAATRSFKRKVTALEQLRDDELRQILAAMPPVAS